MITDISLEKGDTRGDEDGMVLRLVIRHDLTPEEYQTITKAIKTLESFIKEVPEEEK